MKTDFDSLPVLGVASAATDEYLGLQLGLRTFEQVKENLARCVYWAEFCKLARAGYVEEDFLPGLYGRLVLGWATGAK